MKRTGRLSKAEPIVKEGGYPLERRSTVVLTPAVLRQLGPHRARLPYQPVHPRYKIGGVLQRGAFDEEGLVEEDAGDVGGGGVVG